jgi:hypothetical protein
MRFYIAICTGGTLKNALDSDAFLFTIA